MSGRSITLIDLLVLLAILAIGGVLIFAMLKPAREHDGHITFQSRCAGQLHQIGVALFLYAENNNGRFPAIPMDTGSPDTVRIIGMDINQTTGKNHGQSSWRNLTINGPDDPFAKDVQGRFAGPIQSPTVSASLWLLIRNHMSTPNIFVCRAIKTQNEKEDPLEESNNITQSPEYFSDFYTDPKAGTLFSYSFIPPYSKQWASDGKPDLIIAGDANNGFRPDYWTGQGIPGQKDLEAYANSTNHGGKGQNVLYLEGSVKFTTTPYCGFSNDNIYTALPEKHQGRTDQTPGVLRVRPRDARDTVLVPNREADLEKWDRKP